MDANNILTSLLDKKTEGSYWDFKQEWYKNNVDLLKDIICMANNTTPDMKDGYIIFGVEDKTFNLVGINKDPNRKKQENILGFLSDQSWSNEEIPEISLETVIRNGLEIDILIIYNKPVTPYYVLNDYSKTVTTKNGVKEKLEVQAGVIYSRVGDRNTSSSRCATKQSTEFLWKKRFGLVGTDEFKIRKRLQNIDNWYSIDDYSTIYNSEYSDIQIKRDNHYNLEVELTETSCDTPTWVMDFPYLFSSMLNWNMSNNETGKRKKWDIFLNGRPTEYSIYGVQGTRQDYFHIEPCTKFLEIKGIPIVPNLDSIQYCSYQIDSIEYLSYKLFFEKQCYHGNQKALNKSFNSIPVFYSLQEETNFINYIKLNSDEFRSAVEAQSVSEMFPTYTQNIGTAKVYKVCKCMVEWLDNWRSKQSKRASF